MENRERSKGGCWTCKLRKKKCDENRPSCSVCNSLHITCHGYGAKPTWMNGKTAEKAMTAAIRKTVKETTDRNRRIRILRMGIHQRASAGKHDDEEKTPDILTEEVSLHFSTQSIYPSEETLDILSLQNTVAEQNASSNKGVPNSLLDSKDYDEMTWKYLLNNLSQDEGGLLMHYLDHVFPLQFQMYRPEPPEGGLGWLLAILTNIKPLYHVALSIAAYHQHFELYFGGSMGSELPRCSKLDELQKQYILALQGLRVHLQRFVSNAREMSLIDRIEVLACVTLLVSLEAFKRSGDGWQIHMKAALSLVHPLMKDNMIAECTRLPDTYRTAHRFFTGVLAWYDILSCATTGSGPFSQWRCLDLDAGLGYINLNKLMGCENWVMLSIRDVATLKDWKAQMQAENLLSLRELLLRAHIIEERLENGLKECLDVFDGPFLQKQSLTSSGVLLNDSKFVNCLITRIFACSTLVYLHVTVSGAYPELPEISQAVTRTITAFRAASQIGIADRLTWPMCVAGCMAIGEQESSFRECISKSNINSFTFGSSWNAINIIEECWKMRKDNNYNKSSVNWETAMESLGLNFLFV